MAEDYEGISETQITFYRVQGHNHDGENSSKIDLSKYDLSDIVDMSQFNSAVLSSVENAVIKPKGIIVGIGDAVLDLDGSDPSAPTGVTVTSTADPDSPGNILINVAWDVDADGANNTYIVELWKSTTGISGTYIVSRFAESTGNSHVFEWVDNRSGDVGSVYYKVRVMSVSPMGIRSVAYEATVAPASDSSIPGAITFNDDFSNFDEGLKTTFRGFFVKLDDSSEFDVKQGRGEYEWQVSTNNTAGNFDAAANLKASGRSKSTYIVVNSLEVRASAGAAKINYYLRVRAVDSSNNSGPWVYYRSTAGGGSNGAGSSTVGNASAITILEITGTVDIEGGSITADEIQALTITADEIAADAIEAGKIKGGEITADKFVSLLSFTAGGDMQSTDFVSGTSGWKIEGGVSGGDSGTAEFQSITVRGVINATTGYLGGTDGWTIAADTIQSGTGSAAVRIGTGGSSGTAFIRLGTKTGWNTTGAGIWMDPTNGLVIGTGTGVFSASSTGVITASAGTIGGWSMDGDALYTGTKDVSAYTAGGITLSSANGGSLHAENFYLATNGNAYFKGYVEATAGLLGGWTVGTGKIHYGTDIELGLTNQAVSVGGGRAVIRRFVTGGAGDGDLKIGIDASAGYDPVYGTAGDMVMWWDHSASLAKFSLSDKLLFDGSNLTLVDGVITSGTIQTASSGSRLMLSPINALPDVTVDTGTAQAGASTTITLKSGSSSTNDYYNELTITLASGPGSGDVRTISDYVGSSKVATVSAAWTTNPTSSTTYSITRKTNTFLRGYTGNATENYPGFIYYYGERDLVTQSRQWGRVAFSAPKFSATLALSGFVFSHSDDGHGELTFGLPYNTDQFVIADTGSSSTPTNTFNRGGITIVSGTPVSTNNTLYADGTTLKWHGSTIGSGGGGDMDSWFLKADGESPGIEVTDGEALNISGGSNVTVTRVSQSISIAATDTTYTAASPITLSSGEFGFAWPASTNMGVANYTAVDSNAVSMLVKSNVDNNNGTMNWFDIADLNVSKFYNDAGYTTIAAGVSYGFMTASSSHSLTNKSGNISQWNNDSGYITSATVTFPLHGSSGSQAAPTYAFSGDTHTGMYRPADNQIAFSVGNSLRMTFNSTGIHGNYTYYSTGSMVPATDTYYSIGSSTKFWNYGYTYRQKTHGSTTSGDLLVVHSNVIKIYGSSERHKDNITTIAGADALARIKALRPVEFTWIPGPDDDVDVKNDYTGFSTHRGFIAEEIAEVDHWYATYNWWKSDDPESDDYRRRIDEITEHTPNPTDEQVDEYYDLSEAKPMAWKWDAVITDLVSVVQNLEARVAALEA